MQAYMSDARQNGAKLLLNAEVISGDLTGSLLLAQALNLMRLVISQILSCKESDSTRQ